MGYVAAYYKGKEDPPAALVLTESAVTFLVFPFVSQKEEDLERCFIGAGCTLDLWTEQDDLCQGVVHLLAQLVDCDMRNYAIHHPTAKSYEFMHYSTARRSRNRQIDERND